MSACESFAKPEVLPPPAPVEKDVSFAPIDGALLDCPSGPDLVAAMAQVEAVKYDPAVPPSQRANLIIGIQGVAMIRYQSDLIDCRSKLDTIRATQRQDMPAP